MATAFVANGSLRGIALTITPDSAIATAASRMSASDTTGTSALSWSMKTMPIPMTAMSPPTNPWTWKRSWPWAMARPNVNSGVSAIRTMAVPAGTSRKPMYAKP